MLYILFPFLHEFGVIVKRKQGNWRKFGGFGSFYHKFGDVIVIIFAKSGQYLQG
jgi:hypothetical protein